MIMGLSSKQVSGDGFDWSQGLSKSGGLEILQPPPPPMPAAQPAARQPPKQRQPVAAQQQQGPPLRCPRCDSTNTKFCYYNNYSRSQPRHLCKACRRHWTDGGTLRNVPVGGGRKAKRPKTSHPSSSADPTTNNAQANGGGNSNDVPTIHPPRPEHPPPLSFASDILCSALLPPPLPPSEYANSSFLGSLLTVPTTHRFAGATSAGMIDGGVGYPFSASPTFPSLLNLTGNADFAEVDAIAATIRGSMAGPPSWELLPPTCSGVPSGNTITTTTSGLTVIEESSPPSSGYWGSCWDDLAGFLSPDNKHPTPSSAAAPPQYFQLS